MFYPSQEYAPIGSLKARYRPLGLVAQGQFGKVYCAVHRSSGRLVALKLLDRQRSTTSQFLRELSSLLSLRHPALTQLRAIEQTDAGRCLVLDYCAGGTLRHLLESPNLPRQDLMLRCLVQILEGLAHAHGRGVVHCDVKPENILMQPEPQGWRACLTDFGIAQSHFGGDVIAGDPAFERGGSPAYMAPERFAGEAYQASDLYSVGIILYEVLLGDRPFHGSPNALREAHRQEPVKFPRPLNIAFQKLLYRALSKSPDLRYENAKTMALDLRHALETVTPPPPSTASHGPALFSWAEPEELLSWPEPGAVGQSLSWELEPTDKVYLAGISPLVHGVDASSQMTAESWEEHLDSAPARTSGLLKPQVWFSQGLNLQGLLLDSPDGEGLNPVKLTRLTLPETLKDVALSPRYGFALTHTALYRWPLISGENVSCFESSPKGANAETESLSLHCLIAGQADLAQVVLSPQGHWAAIAKRCPQKLASPSGSSSEDSLLLLGLGNNVRGNSGPRKGKEVRELKLRSSETLAGVQLLDRRHGAALLASVDEPQRLGLFSRRGQWLSYFTLPVSLGYWVRGIPAYELWALEAGHPQVLLKVGLKPFRLERIPLAIAPDQIYPLPWGCVLANQAGEILLLNREGQSLGQVQVPLPEDYQKLWLVIMAPHSLVIVVQQLQGLKFLPLDLRPLELMLVF